MPEPTNADRELARRIVDHFGHGVRCSDGVEVELVAAIIAEHMEPEEA